MAIVTRAIAHHQAYSVTDDGKVFSHKYGRQVELRQSEHKGYRRVALSQNNKRTNYPVHRLVAEAFIPNPDEKPFVNHIDGNKRNNEVQNLQWCTASENQKHAYDVLNVRNGHTGYKYAKLYPNEELRSRLVELGVPRWKHNLAELGEMLPAIVEYKGTRRFPVSRSKEDATGVREYKCFLDGTSLMDCFFIAKTEADARAKMLIYLIENKLISV